MTHRLTMTLGDIGQSGQRYDVWFEGEVLVTGTLTPMCAGCRALQARGLTGPVEMWDSVRPYPRMRGRVESTALLTVQENEKVGPRWGRYKAFGEGFLVGARASCLEDSEASPALHGGSSRGGRHG